MAEYSVGDALRLLIARSGWGAKVQELRMKQEWEAIAGKTIARYTNNIQLQNRVLSIQTDVAPLKQELQLGKEALINQINAYFKETVVLDIKIR
jgi:predicted nucleic acid-binding Zn ribbon protein